MLEKCPYCKGVKRIRNDLVHYTFRHIVKIQNGNDYPDYFALVMYEDK